MLGYSFILQATSENSLTSTGESLELCSREAVSSTVLHRSSAVALYNLAVLVRAFSQERVVIAPGGTKLSKRDVMPSAKPYETSEPFLVLCNNYPMQF